MSLALKHRHTILGETHKGLTNVGLIFLFYVRLTRASQVYNFPINLSEEIQPAAIFYGTVVPVAVFWVVKMLIVNPFVKMEKEM